MTIILGIDPGSRITGYGLVKFTNSRFSYLDSGCLQVGSKELPERLYAIFVGLQQVIERYRPEQAAIEQVFIHQNAGGALKLGQARGAAMVAVVAQGVAIAEYSARQIKQAVVGYGAA